MVFPFDLRCVRVTYVCLCVCAHVHVCVTILWKTDQTVTLDPFHLIAPANSYTHTLPMHSVITSLT